MTEEKFKVGDVVRMRSGGPSMTILEISPSPMNKSYVYTCGYFDKNDRLHKTTLIRESIVKN